MMMQFRILWIIPSKKEDFKRIINFVKMTFTDAECFISRIVCLGSGGSSYAAKLAKSPTNQEQTQFLCYQTVRICEWHKWMVRN